MSDNEKGGNGAEPPAGGPAGAEEPTSEAAAEPSEEAEAKIGRLEKERQEAHERMLRVAAEFDNWKKRARREVDESLARGREQLAKEILPVLDNLERALAAIGAGGSVEQLGQGVKLVDKQLHSVLEKFEIRGFDALGEPFDPAKHEAIQQVETDEHPAGAVAKVFARGYTIGPRLLRPAMVAVAKAAAKEPSAPSGDGAAADESDT